MLTFDIRHFNSVQGFLFSIKKMKRKYYNLLGRAFYMPN